MTYNQNPSRKIVGQDRPKTDTERQIEEIEKELKELPHHKATDHHIGRLRAKLAHLKDKQVESGIKSKGGGGGGGYSVKKQGDATVVLVGPPSAGKSTLINKLTNAESKVAAYAFTTVSVIPGMLKYKEAYIQILDVPGLIEGAASGKGRGREVLSVARNCDLIIIMTDPTRPNELSRITQELYGAGVRLNSKKPEVYIDKKIDGGLSIHTNLKQEFTKDTVKEIASEFGVKNGDITIKETLSLDRLIDAFSKSRVYTPALYVMNKVDSDRNFEGLAYDVVKISAENDIGLENLKEKMWEKLQFVQVYLVNRDEEPHFNSPIIMKRGETLADLAIKIGSEFAESKKYAKIWGNGARFPAQEVSLEAEIQEGMQVRFL